MKVIHLRFGNTISAELAEIRFKQNRFKRLLKDSPIGIQIKFRTKSHETDLKLTYKRRLYLSFGAAMGFLLAVFIFYPEYHPTLIIGTKLSAVIQLQHIPETSQRARPPSAPRPSVPLAVEGDEVPDDVTIEITDLNLDNLPINLNLGPVGAIGTTDEPMDISEIDYKPHPIRIAAPEYPKKARRSKIEGIVVVRVLVGKNGDVEKVEIINGPGIFQKEAVSAAYQFRFRPGKHEGERRKVWMIMPISFTLN